MHKSTVKVNGETLERVVWAQRPGALKDERIGRVNIDRHSQWCKSTDKGRTWRTISDREGDKFRRRT